MKKLLFLALIVLCMSCTKDPVELIDPKNVDITFDYTFPKSGNIAPKGTSAYLTFYHKYIESKMLTPRTYYINLYDPENHIGANIYGKWGKKSLSVVPPGRYIAEGISWPVGYVQNGTAFTNTVSGDTAYLAFHDTITVTHISTNFTLNAEYDCALVLLDTTEVVDTRMFLIDTTDLHIFTPYSKSVKTKMMKTDEFYHSFLFNGTLNGDGQNKLDLNLDITSSKMEFIYINPDLGTPSYHPGPSYWANIHYTIPLWTYHMQEGKYYLFERTENGYIIPPMGSNN